MHKPIIGLIGGIGSGKSQAAAEFARHGGRIIQADQLGHEGLRQPEIREQVRRRCGPEIVNKEGEIDRRKLGAIVFADAAERRALEALLFPWIERRFREEAERANRDPTVRFVVLDAAVMLEAGWDRVCDQLAFVDAPRDERLRRLAEQRGWSAEEVEAREKAQMPLAEKAKRADAVIVNGGSREELARQIDELVKRWGLSPGI